jgi:hypothetical protein
MCYIKKFTCIAMSCFLLTAYCACKDSNKENSSSRQFNESDIVEDNYDWLEGQND